MDLDLIIPTYNRSLLLQETLESVLCAPRPLGLNLTVTVVDNNSTDNTAEVVTALQKDAPILLRYLVESVQGRSSSLNAGIAATRGNLIGMIDDDELLDASWYNVVAGRFSGEQHVDFIGGKCLPRWETNPPPWLPSKGLRSILGWVDFGDRAQFYGDALPGVIAHGGNLVVRRSLLERVGPYNANLGRTGTRLLCGEDEDMFTRMVSAGGIGMYDPGLIIHHWVPSYRLTKAYFRRSFWSAGVSYSRMLQPDHEACVQILGIPRYLLGKALRGGVRVVSDSLRRTPPSELFYGELEIIYSLGFIWGKCSSVVTPARLRPAERVPDKL